MIKPILLGSAVFLTGCATILTGSTLSSNDIKRANAYCAANGGVQSVSAGYNETVSVVCKNTMTVQFQIGGS